MAGFQVPVILFVELVGKTGAVVFCTNGPSCAKAGITAAVITTSMVVVVAPCPAVGVKVYVVVPTVAVLIVAALQVPVILLVDVVGRAGAVLFWHNGPMAAKVGVLAALITIAIVAVVAHWPAAGVKV